MGTNGHTNDDLAEFERIGLDPYLTQPRERAVPCSMCGRMTWNQRGGCSRHYVGRDGALTSAAGAGSVG